jgi:hypothetical protein
VRGDEKEHDHQHAHSRAEVASVDGNRQRAAVQQSGVNATRSTGAGEAAKLIRETEHQRRADHQVRDQPGESFAGGMQQQLATDHAAGHADQHQCPEQFAIGRPPIHERGRNSARQRDDRGGRVRRDGIDSSKHQRRENHKRASARQGIGDAGQGGRDEQDDPGEGRDAVQNSPC